MKDEYERRIRICKDWIWRWTWRIRTESFTFSRCSPSTYSCSCSSNTVTAIAAAFTFIQLQVVEQLFQVYVLRCMLFLSYCLAQSFMQVSISTCSGNKRRRPVFEYPGSLAETRLRRNCRYKTDMISRAIMDKIGYASLQSRHHSSMKDRNGEPERGGEWE
jgi:hypothetical protein